MNANKCEEGGGGQGAGHIGLTWIGIELH